MRAGRGKATVEAQRMRRIVEGVVALTARRGVAVPFTVCRACGMREDRWHADDCPSLVEAFRSPFDLIEQKRRDLLAIKLPVIELSEQERRDLLAIGPGPVEPLEPPAPPRLISAPSIEAAKIKPAAVARMRPAKIDPGSIPSAMEKHAAGWGR